MKDEKCGKRQQQSIRLIEEAFCYLLEQISYEEINIAMICRQATVSRSTFYRLFQNKKEVLISVLARKTRETTAMYERVITSGASEGQQELYQSYLGFFNYWYHCKELLVFFETDHLFELFWEVYTQNYTNTTTDRVIAENEDTEAFGYYYLRLIAVDLITALHLWQSNGFQESPEQLANIMVQIRKVQQIPS